MLLKNNLAILLLFALLIISCSETKEAEQPFVQPPIAHLDPEFTLISFDAAQGLTHVLDNGGEIKIPANALVNEMGEPITGKVDAKYREFHEVGNIFLAGIPMSLEVGGKTQHFETAGSFQLQVEQNEKALLLKQGQSAQVKMASQVGGDDYDFYFLDEKKKGWTEKGTATPEVNTVKVKARKKLKRMKTGLRFPLNRRYLAFNYDIIVDIYLNNNLTSVNHDYIQQKMKAYGLGWADVRITNTIDHNGKQELGGLMVWKNKSQKRFPEWTQKRPGTVLPIKGKKYALHVYSKDSTQHFTTDLEWIMPLKSLFAFPPEEWLANYQSNMQKIEQERVRVKQMAEVFRSFELAEFGIYNWDRLMKEEERVELMAAFTFDVPVNERLNNMEILYISGDNRSLIRLQNHYDRPIALVPDEKARIFSILPGNRLALLSADEYAAIDFTVLKLRKEERHEFVLKAQTVDLNDEQAFKTVLGIEEEYVL